MVTTNSSSSGTANTIGDSYGFNSTSNPYTTFSYPQTTSTTWESDTKVYDEVIKIKKMFFAFLNMFAIVMADKSCDNGGECGRCAYCYFNQAYAEYVKEILEKM